MTELEVLGKIAGISGIAIGAVVLVFRDSIARAASLPSEKAYRLLNTVVVLSFVIAVAGLGAWIWVGSKPSPEQLLADSRAKCLEQLAKAQKDGKALPNAVISAGGDVKAGGDIQIMSADKLGGAVIAADCGDVAAGGKIGITTSGSPAEGDSKPK